MTIGRVFLLILVLTSSLRAQSLDEVLERAGQGVQKFGVDLSGVKCTENLTQLKLDARGKKVLHSFSSFDYVATVHLEDTLPKLEESRLKQGTSPKHIEEAQFTTTGFAGLMLIFHPQIRINFVFADAPADQLNGRTVRHIQFEHKAGTPSITAFQDRDRIFPIDWTGDAWIDPADGAILRIQAHLMAPISNLGLRSLEALVDYTAIRFPDEDISYWLPRNATIDLKTDHQHWRNTHTFSNYRRFAATVRTVAP